MASTFLLILMVIDFIVIQAIAIFYYFAGTLRIFTIIAAIDTTNLRYYIGDGADRAGLFEEDEDE